MDKSDQWACADERYFSAGLDQVIASSELGPRMLLQIQHTETHAPQIAWLLKVIIYLSQ